MACPWLLAALAAGLVGWRWIRRRCPRRLARRLRELRRGE